MRDDPEVIDLVQRALAGDRVAWERIVDRYAALIWSICRRFRLSDSDADDVAATVWLRLVERLDTLRQPAALPGWLAQTTHRECLQLLRARKRQVPVDDLEVAGPPEADVDQGVLAAERRQAMREAFADLSERCRRLLAMLAGDPAPSYADVSTTLGLPIGSIGPTRGRCLDQLRRHRALVGFGSA